ncbi:chaperone modulator CbpM [Anabaena sp. UHCC 0399]|uniref:chaperone modulator CbpM n=1 Tax=Anabaena sp. UHCC 0399 TaxID=3110238 RepID=UPI002B1FEFD8|nr:chaperone modulator CbpM [Anabaena sp. UHCC 0399]MEA5569023.1 chaperone modulator CbpM [Anabaena sp. UHCC 0399]
MTEFSLSQVVVSQEGEQLYSFEYAATVTKTSTTLVESFAQLGLIEPVGVMLSRRDITRIAQIQRLRHDLGLNLVGAAMVLDMAQEIANLRTQNQAYQSLLDTMLDIKTQK